MDQIIKKMKKEAYSGRDILKACDWKTKIVKYSELKKYDSLDELLNPFGCVVLLYETRPNYGHWVCIIRHKDSSVEFYDSYGIFIDDQLDNIDVVMRKRLGVNYPYLSELLVNSGSKIVFNKYRLQKMKNDINSCGRHVAFRIIMRDLNINEYTKLLINSHMDPDSTITYLTAFVN